MEREQQKNRLRRRLACQLRKNAARDLRRALALQLDGKWQVTAACSAVEADDGKDTSRIAASAK